jgi:hypothetical protein
MAGAKATGIWTEAAGALIFLSIIFLPKNSWRLAAALGREGQEYGGQENEGQESGSRNVIGLVCLASYSCPSYSCPKTPGGRPRRSEGKDRNMGDRKMKGKNLGAGM